MEVSSSVVGLWIDMFLRTVILHKKCIKSEFRKRLSYENSADYICLKTAMYKPTFEDVCKTDNSNIVLISSAKRLTAGSICVVWHQFGLAPS
jgi:hypothetical protein